MWHHHHFVLYTLYQYHTQTERKQKLIATSLSRFFPSSFAKTNELITACFLSLFFHSSVPPNPKGI